MTSLESTTDRDVRLSGKRVLVVGLGKSGVAAARFVAERGARTQGNDLRSREELGSVAKELEEAGVELVLGAHDAAVFREAELIVVSPGVPPLPAIDEALAAGTTVIGEIELASWFLRSTVIGITGTNGKSTVTTMIGEMCRATGKPTFVGGNLGTPLIDAAASAAAAPGGFVVVELSSFQLERVPTFRPDVAVLLNVTDDHLDRYSYFEAYAEAKANIFKNQVATDSAVIPFDDRLCRRLAEGGKGTILAFGGDQGDVRPADGRLVNGSSGLAFDLSRLRVSGGHNVDNACAAALAARAAGVDVASVEAGLAAFKGLPHRMEWVQMVDGVTFYDDSKATNVGATVAALDGMGSGEGKVVLIAGGRDKGGSYAPIRDRMERVGRAVVLLGEAAAEIERAFQGSSVPLLMAKDMDEAVSLAAGAARAGDSVLLAPACSSYDMFTSYVERGHAFQGSVRRMEGKGTTG